MDIRTFRSEDEQAVINLWKQCGLTRPWNDPRKDIERKLSEHPELFFIGCLGPEVIATAMAGFDGHRGWVYYLAVSPDHQKQSYGRRLMQVVEKSLIDLGCPKLNLQIRTSNQDVIAFYRTLGYKQDEVVSLGRRLISDHESTV